MAKCIECGLLQIMDRKSREFVAVEPEIRESGSIPREWIDRVGDKEIYERRFACLAGFRALNTEMDELHGLPSWHNRMVGVLRAECDCPHFQRYQPGLSPKEHIEMTLVQAVRDEAAKQRQEDVAWQRSVEDAIERRFQQQETNSDSRHKATEGANQGRHLSNYVLTGLVVIGALVGDLIERAAAAIAALF